MNLSTGLRKAIIGNYGLGLCMNKGVIRVYSGTPPSSADLAPTGILLGEISREGIGYEPALKDIAGLELSVSAQGVLTKKGIWKLRCIYNGLAGWFRWNSSQYDDFLFNQTVYRVDGTVGVELFLAERQLNTNTITEIERFEIQLNVS